MSLFVASVLATIGLGIYISSIYSSAINITLDEEKLSSSALSISVYDNKNSLIKEDNEISKAYASIQEIPQHVKDAFISIEDKTFYQHSGVNYKRMAKATLNNLKSRSLKEGASTITQQLIKNTFLSSEKTFERKIKEVALAKKLEKKYDKDKILEMYLNVIYFGNNCYGIESASNYYFSKPTSQLSLEESALLAGMIKSPARYSPIKKANNSLTRRNLVLAQMCQDGLISESECRLAQTSPIKLTLNKERQNKLNSYAQASIDEAEEILSLPAKQIALKGYKIYTYQDSEKQSALEEAISSVMPECDYAGIVMDNEKGQVNAYIGNSIYKILDAKRSPGSCIKPILVYGPALNEDLIYPCSQILDEKISIGEYSPKNVGNVYHGYVSVREALSKSYNIPTVKVLSYVGVDKAKAYASSMGIEFDEQDDSYSLALGGMTYGCDLRSLAGAYSTFANGGNYIPPSFVSFITDSNGKLIYINENHPQKVLREDSCYLINDMLKTCAKEGTAKRLNDLPCEIASKTGTVGKQNSSENLDAWNISYTKNQTCAVWLGNLDNTPISYTGGNQPTQISKSYFLNVGDNSHFDRPSSIVERTIDDTELRENHRIMLASSYMPERYTQKEFFSAFNLPTDISTKFTQLEEPKITSYVSQGKAIIEFEAKDYVTYQIKREDEIIKEIVGMKGNQHYEIPLLTQNESLTIESFYTLTPEISNTKNIKFVKKARATSNKWYI